jgi:phosphoenolpyruvate carboxykinase (GTP)
MHFPEELAIKSFGSGYGGNALLGKKCHALRIASYQARRRLARRAHADRRPPEPAGRDALHRRGLPVACGKTNLAMLIPPEGRCRAGRCSRSATTSAGCSPGRMAACMRSTRSRLLRRGAGHQPEDQQERLRHDPARHDLHQRRADRRQRALVGRPRTAARPSSTGRAARTIRRTARPRIRIRASPSAPPVPELSPEAENPQGVPLSPSSSAAAAANRWCRWCTKRATGAHGVLVGASMASETTAAATGAVGVVRRDPMAMKPFCGYNFGDYFATG